MQRNAITSTKNENIKLLKKLSQKKYREEYNLYLIEGIKIINEALQNNEEFEYLIYDERYQNNTIPAKIKLYVEFDILKYISALGNPQGIIAAVKKNQRTDFICEGKWVYLDGVADPTNAAAIVRSADCAGFDGVVFGNGSVDIYNDKFLRASMGSNYHIKVVNFEDEMNCINSFKDMGFFIIGADLNGGSVTNIKNKNILLIIGNESLGISDKVLMMCDSLIRIPIYGKAESLNAACAATVLMYMINGYIN